MQVRSGKMLYSQTKMKLTDCFWIQQGISVKYWWDDVQTEIFSSRLASVYVEVNGSQQDPSSEFKASMLTNKQQHNSGRPQSVSRAGLGSVSTKNTEEWVFSLERVEQRRADLWFPLWGAHVLLSQSHNKTNAHLYIFPENIRHGYTDPIQLSQNRFDVFQTAVQAKSRSVLLRWLCG